MSIFQPRLFLSYARADLHDADQLVSALVAERCRVWLDRDELLVGDDFVRGLSEQLSGSDGLVFLLTEKSAGSSWCQAELQRALALEMPVFIVQRDPEARFPDAIERLLRDVQRLVWRDGGVLGLAEQIHRARWRRRIRLLKTLAVWLVIMVPVIGLVSLAVWRMDAIKAARERADVVDRIENASGFWSRSETDAVLAPTSGDGRMPATLYNLAEDATLPVSARHNAWQALTSIHENREREWRTYVPEVSWTGGKIRDALWANTTYSTGDIRGLEVESSRIAGIVFGKGPTANEPGLSILGARFVDSDAWFLVIAGTQLIDVEFRDVRMRAAQLDLSGHGGVRFVTSQADLNAPLTSAVAIIEDSFIEQRSPLPGPDVLDLATPEQEILFDGVQFHRTHFSGEFKAEWFRNSFFEECVFDTTLTEAALLAGGNSIDAPLWLDDTAVPE